MPEETKYNDNELLQLIAGDDETAFRQLFSLYQNKLATYVLKITNSFPLTEEIVQDIFLRIWQYRASLTTVRNFDAYLFTIAHNHTINCITRLAREERRYHEWEYQAVITGADETGTADRREHHYQLLENAILLLPPQQQRIYLLHRQEGLPHAAIAEKMGLALDTVKKQMSRALKNIRIFLLKNNNQFFSWGVPLFLISVVL